MSRETARVPISPLRLSTLSGGVQAEDRDSLREALKPRDKTICVLNKVDKIAKDHLLPLIAELSAKGWFDDVVPVSALKGSNVDRLAQVLRAKLPEGQAMYPADAITDRSEDFLVSEMVREKIYQATHQEIPYSAWIEIEEAPLVDDVKTPTIRAVIHVDSDSRKGILIGKKGEMLKRIGTAARRDIEQHLGHKVCLKLHVDVHNEWKRDSRHLSQYLELN